MPPEAMTEDWTLAILRGGMTSPSRVAFPNALQLLFLAFQCALTSTGSRGRIQGFDGLWLTV